MRFFSHPLKLPIQSVEIGEISKPIDNPHCLLPESIRCIICGPSGCGKTNVLLSLLYDKNGLKYENVYLYSKSLLQPKYIQLEKIMTLIPEIGFFKFADNDAIISLDKVKPNSIFIFDDIACEKQDNVKRMYSYGRHQGLSCFLLTQTYSAVAKQLIRDNANFLILFRQDGRNLLHIFREHVFPDVSLQVFQEMCGNCWTDPYGFIVLDKTKPINRGRYRKGFDKFIIP
jgi:GTPase SAR1 family protein